MTDIVNKLWGFCHTLRHDGVDYGDYIEQLTYLLFLKMAEERGATIPATCDWKTLKAKSGTALTDHYADILRKLREAGGLLADIFTQAVPRFNNPVGQAETQSSQRVQASTNTASGMLQGGRNGATRVLLPKKRRRDGFMIHETSR